MTRRRGRCEIVHVDGAAVRVQRAGQKPLTPRDVEALEQLVRYVRSMVTVEDLRARSRAWFMRDRSAAYAAFGSSST
jgi:hypothetical protein